YRAGVDLDADARRTRGAIRARRECAPDAARCRATTRRVGLRVAGVRCGVRAYRRFGRSAAVPVTAAAAECQHSGEVHGSKEAAADGTRSPHSAPIARAAQLRYPALPA